MRETKITRKNITIVKLAALMTACVIALSALTGCSSPKENAERPAQTEQETGSEKEEPSASQGKQDASSDQAAPADQTASSDQVTPTEQTASEENSSLNPLTLQVLKVGKADAMVLTCGDAVMVIDCGEKEDGEEVLDYLAQKGAGKVHILLITHFDKDHVGGADTVVEGIPVDRILMPDYEGTGKQYKEFVDALDDLGMEPERVAEVLNLQLGDAAIKVEPPASYEIPDTDDEYDNNFSLITTVDLGKNRLVFTGDIEEERITEWLDGGTVQKCDVLKIPHHGFYNEPLEEMVGIMQPSYAVICDSEKNPAEKKTVSMLEEKGAQCLQTKDGDITIVCDGENIEVSR